MRRTQDQLVKRLANVEYSMSFMVTRLALIFDCVKQHPTTSEAVLEIQRNPIINTTPTTASELPIDRNPPVPEMFIQNTDLNVTASASVSLSTADRHGNIATTIAFQDTRHDSSSNQSEGSNFHPFNASRCQTADGVGNSFASDKTLVPITPNVLNQPQQLHMEGTPAPIEAKYNYSHINQSMHDEIMNLQWLRWPIIRFDGSIRSKTISERVQ